MFTNILTIDNKKIACYKTLYFDTKYFDFYHHHHNNKVNRYKVRIRKYVDSNLLIEKSKAFFKKNGLLLNWREFEKLDGTQKVNTLSMISPITNEEKQKLLEATTIVEKINTLESIISFYLHDTSFNTQTIQ